MDDLQGPFNEQKPHEIPFPQFNPQRYIFFKVNLTDLSSRIIRFKLKLVWIIFSLRLPDNTLPPLKVRSPSQNVAPSFSSGQEVALPALRRVQGVLSVQRVVCGCNKEFKVISNFA